MRRPAFTLAEVVLSLALLGILTVAAVSWTATAVKARAASLGSSELARQTHSLEWLVRVDLFNVDAGLTTSMRRESRVWIEQGNLHVLTRDRGAAEVKYSHDPKHESVVRSIRVLDGDRSWSESVVVQEVVNFLPSIGKTAHSNWESVELEVSSKDTENRTLAFTVPSEWTP